MITPGVVGVEVVLGLQVGSTAPAFLAVLALVASSAATIGQVARRRHRMEDQAGDRPHILGMGISYVALLTAFYVDNGPHLPVWERLPVVVFWLAPPLIGAVLIARAAR